MTKTLGRAVAALVAMIFSITLLVSPVLADNSASAFTNDGTAIIGAASAAAAVSSPDGFTKVLSTTLKNSGEVKDLVIGLSFETSLFTMTMVQSKGGKKSHTLADAEIEMYVTVDGIEAKPGVITFDKRRQELWASLGGVPEDCNDLNGDGIVSFDECTLTEEEIGLILDTKAAHSFNFLAYDIGSGSHTVEAFARLSRNSEVITGTGGADASASLGKGTLSVWEVHGAVGN